MINIDSVYRRVSNPDYNKSHLSHDINVLGRVMNLLKYKRMQFQSKDDTEHRYKLWMKRRGVTRVSKEIKDALPPRGLLKRANHKASVSLSNRKLSKTKSDDNVITEGTQIEAVRHDLPHLKRAHRGSPEVDENWAMIRNEIKKLNDAGLEFKLNKSDKFPSTARRRINMFKAQCRQSFGVK